MAENEKHVRKRKLTDNQIDDIVKKYEAGSSTVELGKEYGVSNSTIGDYVKSKGIKIRKAEYYKRRILSETEIDEIVRKYKSGLSTNALGMAYRVSPQTVRDVLNKNGIKIKKRRRYSEYQKDIIAKEYVDGMMIVELEKKYKINRSIIGRILKSRGIKNRCADIKVRHKYRRITEDDKKKLLEYINKNPEAIKDDVCDAGFGTTLAKFYKGNVNAARQDAKIDKQHINIRKPLTEERKQEMLKYLKKNPEAGHDDICDAGFLSVLDKFYDNRINDAKRDAGVDEKYIHWRDNARKELARQLL